jgi:hypothetical protein
VALYPGVASHTVSQFDGRNLLWRSVIRYGTSKIWYGPLLKTLAVASLSLPGVPPLSPFDAPEDFNRPPLVDVELV